ncbi:hypothetical protein D3C74_483800 [compost metagenome]
MDPVVASHSPGVVGGATGAGGGGVRCSVVAGGGVSGGPTGGVAVPVTTFFRTVAAPTPASTFTW